MSDIPDKTEQYVLHTYNRAPFTLTRGEGMFVYDETGKRYLDFVSGISVNALGHSDPEIAAAVTDQIAQLSHVCNLYYSAPQANLAALLCESSFADKVYFCNSGTEAVEAAIKFARKYARSSGSNPDKTGIVAFTGSFHGRTMGSLALTIKEKYQAPFRPLMPGVSVAPFNDIDAALNLIGPDTCAVFVEPIQGEGGINSATPEFLRALRTACDRVGALLVFDEIQCGMGRTGTLWAYEQTGVQPDMMTLAKALGGGLPIGATLITDAVAAAIETGDHGSTFAAGPVLCRAAEVVLRRVSDAAMLEHVQKMGNLLLDKLRQLNSPHIVEVRGKGLMVGVEMDFEVAPLIPAGYKHGVLLLNAGTHVLRFLPPLIVEPQHIDQLVETLDDILSEITTA
ncbi:MAG: aspartate aminotransferase family protein [Anaerolineae bacterium]|nr:aspartate aminotransferase family protein [Anaerolineae bacterium]